MDMIEVEAVLVSSIAAAIGAFAGAYLRKSGENLAAKENFAAIREQLKTTTRDTEAIKLQLTGRAWRSQQQWAAREQYYSRILPHLQHFRLALDSLSEYCMRPGSEQSPDSEIGGRFNRLFSDALASFAEVRKLVGPAALFLLSPAVAALEKLSVEHWHLANFDAVCTADYVARATKLSAEAYNQVLKEARLQLGLEEPT